jgi:hypothetical protein
MRKIFEKNKKWIVNYIIGLRGCKVGVGKLVIGNRIHTTTIS